MKDEYFKYARTYPSIVAMAIPAVITTAYCITTDIMVADTWNKVVMLASFAPISILFCAIGFWFSEIGRFTSLIMFQCTRFNANGLHMPTTTMLLGKSKHLSTKTRTAINEKVKALFGMELPSTEDMSDEARIHITNIVGLIRETTRGNHILHQYNQEYGFCRNYLGGSILSFIALVVLIIIGIVVEGLTPCYAVIGFILQIVFDVFFWKAMVISAEQYATHLFNAFLTIKEV